MEPVAPSSMADASPATSRDGWASSITTRAVVAGLTTVAVAWIGAWQTLAATAGDSVTTAEVSHAIATESPYAQDRAYVRATLDDARRDLRAIRSQLEQLAVAQARLEALLAANASRVDRGDG